MSNISSFLPVPPDNFSTQISTPTIGTTDLTIGLDSVAGLATEGVGVLFKKDSDGVIVPGSIEFIHWTGISGSSITLTDTGDRGITGSDAGAQSYVADDYFEVWVSSYYQPTGGILQEHNTDGSHSDITADSLDLGGTTQVSSILDEDTMSSDSATALATQQSIKAYVDPSVTTTASSATPTPTGDKKRNELYVTALAAAAELQAPSGTPANGNTLVVRIKDDGTARALTYNAIYRGIVADLPDTTTISKTLYMGFFYNSADSKWDLVATAEES